MKLIIDSVPQLFGLLLAFSVAIGALGTFFEMLGNVLKKPALVKFGQKLEAIGTDIPELLKGTKASAIATAVGAVLLCLVLSTSLTACGFLKGSVWPIVEKCAPSARILVAQVEAVLLAGGDYEATLKQIAVTDGEEAVVCAVKEAVSELAGKIGASESSAAARGHAFLAKTGNAK